MELLQYHGVRRKNAVTTGVIRSSVCHAKRTWNSISTDSVETIPVLHLWTIWVGYLLGTYFRNFIQLNYSLPSCSAILVVAIIVTISYAVDMPPDPPINEPIPINNETTNLTDSAWTPVLLFVNQSWPLAGENSEAFQESHINSDYIQSR